MLNFANTFLIVTALLTLMLTKSCSKYTVSSASCTSESRPPFIPCNAYNILTAYTIIWCLINLRCFCLYYSQNVKKKLKTVRLHWERQNSMHAHHAVSERKTTNSGFNMCLVSWQTDQDHKYTGCAFTGTLIIIMFLWAQQGVYIWSVAKVMFNCVLAVSSEMSVQ